MPLRLAQEFCFKISEAAHIIPACRWIGAQRAALLIVFLMLIRVIDAGASYREVELFDRGYEYYLAYQPERAADTLRQFLREFPESPNRDAALFWLGKSLIQLRSFEEARGAFSEIRERFPESPFIPHIEREMATIGAASLGKTGPAETAAPETRGPPAGAPVEMRKREEPAGDALLKALQDREKLTLLLQEEKEKAGHLSARIADFEKREAEFKKITETAEAHAALQRTYSDLAKTTESLERSLAEAMQERNKALAQLDEERKKTDEMRAQVAELERKETESRGLAEAAQEHATLRQRLSDLEQKALNNESALSKATEEKEKLMAAIEEERRKTEQLNVQIAGLQEREPDSKRLDEMAAANASLQERLFELEQKAQYAERALTSVTDERDKLTSQLEQERKTAEEQRLKIADMEKREAGSRSVTSRAEADGALTARLAESERRASLSEEALLKSAEERNKLERLLGEEKRTTEQLRIRVAEMEKKGSESKRTSDQARGKSPLEDWLATVEQKADQAEKALARALVERDRLATLLKEEKKRTEELSARTAEPDKGDIETKALSESSQANEAPEKKLAEMEKRMRRVERSLAKTRAERDRLEALLEEERDKTEHMRARIAELEKRESDSRSLGETRK